jgi:hypothetical protein
VWSADGFTTARLACRLVREQTRLLVPDPLPIACDPRRPVQAYWRIPLPTLAELWPSLDDRRREEALISLGVLAGRVHRIRTRGWGPLPLALESARTLEDALHEDLAGRLMPAVACIWPDAYGSLQRLVARIPAAARRVVIAPVLAHNDLHLHNVLCSRDGGRVRCVGLLDLDGTYALPPESDIARFDVLHRPLFEQPIRAAVRARVRDAYPHRLDEALLAFFRAAHLANLGFHSALVGHHEHAAAVAAEFAAEIVESEALLPHEQTRRTQPTRAAVPAAGAP